MTNRRAVSAENFDSLLDCVQKGKLHALQDWLRTGKPIRSPDDAKGVADLLRTAVTTGFHSMVAELLHAGGWSPTELADALDLARSRNRDDIAELILHYSTQSPADDLPRRARNCLAAAGIPLDKQAVLHAFRTGALSCRTPFYGRNTHHDVCLWLGINPFLPIPTNAVGDRVPFSDNGLSYRANGILRRAGIAPERAAVRQALESRTLVPGKRPYSYGEQTHAELCRWVGINPSALAVPLERLSA
jgi:hypothetical protein